MLSLVACGGTAAPSVDIEATVEATFAEERAIGLNPQYADTYYNRGFAYYNLGQYKRAIQDYDDAIRLDPELTAAYNNRAATYSDLGQSLQAIRNYNEAIRLDHKFAIAYVNRSFAWTMMGRDTEAEEDVETATAMGLDRDIIAAKIKELKTQR